MKKTKIVCTIGPASESVDMLVNLINAGMNVCRLNFSHGDYEEHGARIKNIREAVKITGKRVAILLDTKGPEIRTNDMENGAITMKIGDSVRISMTEVLGTNEKFSITYPELINDVNVGSHILLDDGLIDLEVTDIDRDANEIVTVVKNEGVLKNKKGVNVPGVSVNLPGITEKDANDIRFGIGQGIDFIAASFVRRASDVLEITKILEEENATHIQIIPKIENQEGIEKIDEILKVSDGLMVARGDMGVEIPTEDVPVVQKALIKKCNALGKPVITATQMLDSMQRNPRPTRAEANDVANAIYDGTDAVMLSGETASGKYPLEALQMMVHIVENTEEHLDYDLIMRKAEEQRMKSTSSALSHATVTTANNLGAKCIIAPTASGATARVVSKFKPRTEIIGVTPNEEVMRRMQIYWGVRPLKSIEFTTTEDVCSGAIDLVVAKQIVETGDVVVLTAGIPSPHFSGQKEGVSNIMRIAVIQ